MFAVRAGKLFQVTGINKMLPRRSLALPLSLGIVMICLLVALLVGWIIVTVYAGIRDSGSSVYWVLLPIGTVVLGCVLAGVSIYLAISVKSLQVNRQQANFIDAVTHELKSPIAALKLGLETISRRQLSGDDKEKFTQAMKKDINRLDRLISHLLSAAGLNVESKPDMERVDLRQLVEESIEEVCTYRDFDAAHIRIDGECQAFTGPILDFGIVMRNLIDNAVKYSANPPVIKVSMAMSSSSGNQDPKWVILTIDNNGAVVKPSERASVFNRFERTGLELERTKPGVGLGLYIVRLLLDRNQGTIELDAPPDFAGTRVIVKLPFQSDNA